MQICFTVNPSYASFCVYHETATQLEFEELTKRVAALIARQDGSAETTHGTRFEGIRRGVVAVENNADSASSHHGYNKVRTKCRERAVPARSTISGRSREGDGTTRGFYDRQHYRGGPRQFEGIARA
jgi:hypothetical protein